MDAENQRVYNQNRGGWLDASLRARADVEPRVGLEDRVLARLAAEPPRRALTWWPVFAAVAAGLLFTVMLTIMHFRMEPRTTVATPTAPGGPRTAERLTIQAGNAVSKPVHAIRKHGTSTVLVERASYQQQQLPKLATFPAPRPLTAEERILARLAARRGSYEMANTSEDMVPFKDLSVPELSIKPLEGTPPDNTPQD